MIAMSGTPEPTGVGDDHWKMRRRLLFITTGFYMLVVLFCVVRGLDTELARTSTTMCVMALAGNVGAYVFGASWEDLTMAKRGFVRTNSPFIPGPSTGAPNNG